MKSFYVKLLSIICIFCLGIIVYSNTFHCAFQLDDDLSIVDNFFIRNILNLQNIWNFWPCRFITYLSIALNYHFNHLDVLGYHLFNLAIHLASAFFVWWLVQLTFSTPVMRDDKITKDTNLIALLVALVFVVHPIQTEAVTYIVQRAASMASLFYLASLCFYIKSRLLQENNSAVGLQKSYYIASLITAVMAMFTKEITITLPLMILLYEFCFLRTKQNFNWKYLIPFLSTIFIIPLTMVMTKSVNFHEMHRFVEGPSGISSKQYLLTQLRVIVTYIRLVFLPINQNLDYDFSISKSILELPTLCSFLFLIIIFLSALRLFSKYRLLAFSIFWFFLTLLPESSFISIRDVIFEHRLYLPLVGYSIFLVSGVYYFLGKASLKTMVIVLAMIIFSYSVLTYQRNNIWRDNLSLWQDTIQKSPYKARPYNNRGNVYLKQGNFVQAMSDFNKAIELNPDYAEAYDSRSGIYAKEGNLNRAMLDLNKSIELNPRNSKAYYNVGVNLSKAGDTNQAISYFTKAIELNPTYSDAYINRALMCLKSGNPTQAMIDLTKAIEINPQDQEAYSDRGSVYGEGNNFPPAISDFTKAIEINPSYAQAYYNRAGTYYNLNEYNLALDDALKAKELGWYVNPGFIFKLKKLSGQNN